MKHIKLFEQFVNEANKMSMSYKLSFKDKSNVLILLDKIEREDKTKYSTRKITREERGEIISQISDELKINWFEISAYLGHAGFVPFNESTADSINIVKKAIPGVEFNDEEFEFDPEDGYKSVKSYSFMIDGISEPAYINVYDGNSFCFFYDAAPLGTSLHTGSEAKKMAQTQIEVPKPLTKLNKRIYDEVVADIKVDAPANENHYKSFLNEANSDLGLKAKKFNSYIDLWDYFVDADNNKTKEENLPKEWHDALAKLGIKDKDAIVVFFDTVGDKKEVLDTANKVGLKYIEVEDLEGGSDGIVFSLKQ